LVKPRPQKVVGKKLVQGFKKSAGVNSLNSKKAVSMLKARAAGPGNYRAKAILAAKRGNTAKAQRLLAKRAVVKAKSFQAAKAARPAKPPKKAWKAAK
jgi:hypothetical protein